MTTDFYAVREAADGITLALQGEWVISQIGSHEKTMGKHSLPSGKKIILDGKALTALDTAGVLMLKHILAKQPQQDIHLQHFSEDHQRFLEAIWEHKVTLPKGEKEKRSWRMRVENIGRHSSEAAKEGKEIIRFTGIVAIKLLGLWRHPGRFRVPALVRHMDEAGVRALPIVCLLAFLISIVLAYQGAMQLKSFGADIFTVDLTVISILREMGVLLTAIIVAGRSGSAFAAEIGVMKLREEISALHTFGLDPYLLLVLPRIIGLTLMLPVLTFIADMVGLLGTAVMTFLLLDISFAQFIDRTAGVVELHTIMVGLAKAPVFGFLIALVGTYQGMQVSGSAESVGRLTTVSVVQSIFLVILADALFSILFSEFGI